MHRRVGVLLQWQCAPMQCSESRGLQLCASMVCGCIGVDPKSIVCEFFRHGKCTKGFKCKFAHDLAVERKGGKIDIFSDRCERS